MSVIISYIKRRPLLWYMIFAIAGTYYGLSMPDTRLRQLFVSFLVFAISAILIFIIRKLKNGYYNTLSFLFFLFAAISVFYAYRISASLHIKQKNTVLLHKAAVNEKKITIICTIAGDADIRKKHDGYYVWSFPVRLNSIAIAGRDNKYYKSKAMISVDWFGSSPDNARIYGKDSSAGPEYGERWKFTGRIYEHNRRGKTEYKLVAGRYTSAILSNTIKSRIARQCLAARRNAAERLAVGVEDFPLQVSLVRAVLLGYRSDLQKSMKTLFAQVGTLHIFAISGLHVGIVCSLIIFVLSLLTIPRTYWVLIMAPLLIAYTFATGGRPSAIRACIMAIVYFGAPLVWRKADALSAVAFSALLILIFAPEQLFSIGFIYSFTVVCGLIVLFPIINNILGMLMRKVHIFENADVGSSASLFWEPDDFRVEGESFVIIKVRQLVHYIVSLFALSCSAWLVSVPITAYFFGRISVIALFANVIVVPLAFLVVVTGVLSLIAGSGLMIFSDIFNHANLAIINLLIGIMKLIAKIPGAYFNIDSFSHVYVFICLVLLALLVSIYYIKKRHYA